MFCGQRPSFSIVALISATVLMASAADGWSIQSKDISLCSREFSFVTLPAPIVFNGVIQPRTCIQANRLQTNRWNISENAAKSPRPTVLRTGPKAETVNRLIDWIIAKTGWAAKESPTIRLVSHSQLQIIYFGQKPPPNARKILGVYDIKSRIVFLSENWKSDDLRDQSMLLHELVHHLQVLNKVEVVCIPQYNLHAYDLQMDWLREQGIKDPKEFLDINDLTILSVSMCPELLLQLMQ